MKRFENFTKEDLQSLRNEIVLNSLFVSDYNNSFGISAKSVCDFFDSYMEFLSELAFEDNFKIGNPSKGMHTYDEFFDKYDTIDNLENWYGCYEDFSWVDYEDEDEDEIDIAA